MSTTTDAHPWYDPAVWPEWRQAAPWVMEDMIAAQADLIPRTAELAAEPAGQLAAAIRAAVDAGEPIVCCAVGTAGHAARGVAVALNGGLGDALGARVEFRESADQAMAPRRGGVCVAVSHGGQSRSTIEALHAARATGATTAVITATAPDTPAHVESDVVVQLPLKDKSACHTVGYSTPIAVGLVVADRLGGVRFDPAATCEYLTRLQSLAAPASEIGEAIARIERFVAAGSMVDEPAARELALDMAEAAWMPSSVYGVEDLLHGHLVAHDRDSAVTALATFDDGRKTSADLARRLLLAAAHIGLITTAVISESMNDSLPAAATSGGRLGVPDADEPLVTTLLGAALAIQHLTIGLVHRRGTNPDLLRREQAAYREAVAFGEAKLRIG